jgi:outer membrane protein insertion porin family
VNYSDNNFLGTGDNLGINITGGTRETNFTVSLTQPYFLDSPWSMGISLFDTRFRYDTYSAFGVTTTSGNPTELFTQKTKGATISTRRHLGHTLWTFGGSYTYQDIGISDVTPGFEAYAYGQFAGFAPVTNSSSALNGLIRSEISPSLSYNSTNNYFNPTKGSSLNLSAGVSGGILGGDFKMVRPSVEYRHFFPDKWLTHGRNVFGIRLIGQYIQSYGNSSAPFFDRFFVGGEDTIRGFDIRSISPLAISSTPLYDSQGHEIINLKTGLPATSSSIIPVGGDTMGILNFEYRIPIAGPLSLAAFYDAGLNRVSRESSLGNFGAVKVQVVDSTNDVVRGSTGLEIQFILPVVSAPFRLIFAYNPQVLDTSVMVGSSLMHIKEPRHDIKFTVGRSF